MKIFSDSQSRTIEIAMTTLVQSIFSSLVITLSLSSCAALDELAETSRQKIATNLDIFASQLVEDGKPYATLRFYPPASRHYGYRTLDPTPFNIIKFDGKMLTGYQEHLTPHVPLKIPTGTHTFISGRSSANNGYAKFSNINFEDGKHYILRIEKYDHKKRQRTWRLYEYTPDNRFSHNEQESIILGNPVSEPQVDGNKKDVL